MNLGKSFSEQTKHFNLTLGRSLVMFKWPLSSECTQRLSKQNKNSQQNHLKMMHRDLSFYPNHPYHACFPEATLLIRESLTLLTQLIVCFGLNPHSTQAVTESPSTAKQ